MGKARKPKQRNKINISNRRKRMRKIKETHEIIKKLQSDINAE